MKLCYVDESGNSSHTTLSVMTGVLLDFTKVNKHKEIFEDLREGIFSSYRSVSNGKQPQEIKTSQLYCGSGKWSDVDPNIRKGFIKKSCGMCPSIPCDVVFSIVDFNAYNQCKLPLKQIFQGYWQWQACHLILQIQSKYFNEKRNKGNTLVIFDDHHGDLEALHSAFNRKEELHAFYADEVKRKKKSLKPDEKLNQVVDILSIQSKSSLFTQLADIYAFIIRRYFELLTQSESFSGEKEFIHSCFDVLKPRILFKNKYWNRRIAVCEFYKYSAPANFEQFTSIL